MCFAFPSVAFETYLIRVILIHITHAFLCIPYSLLNAILISHSKTEVKTGGSKSTDLHCALCPVGLSPRSRQRCPACRRAALSYGVPRQCTSPRQRWAVWFVAQRERDQDLLVRLQGFARLDNLVAACRLIIPLVLALWHRGVKGVS